MRINPTLSTSSTNKVGGEGEWQATLQGKMKNRFCQQKTRRMV